jgi:hypothetical protein
MALTSSAGARVAHVKIHHRRPGVARSRGTNPGARIPDRPPPRIVTTRIGASSMVRVGDPRSLLPVRIELVRATLLIALAVLAITVVLPMLLLLAAAPLG